MTRHFKDLNTAHRRKFYAVVRGRKPGIYTTWREAEEQVSGYPGNKHKSFDSKEEAEVFLYAEELRCKPAHLAEHEVLTGRNNMNDLPPWDDD